MFMVCEQIWSQLGSVKLNESNQPNSINLNAIAVILLNKFVLLMALLMLVSGCSVYEIQHVEPFKASERWVILPIINHSDTPEAGERATDIAATLLRSRGISKLSNYVVPTATNQALPELNQQKNLQDAIDWATKQGYRFAVSGSVQEWHYKSGLDAEPAAGITLTIMDLNNSQIVWSASGSSTGWGRESVSGVAHELMAKLIDDLHFME